MRNKGTAALLAFFLGGIGAHKFYLGQNVMGLLYLVFSWTTIPFFIAFIEFLAYLLMSEDEFNRRHNFTAMMAGAHNQMGQNMVVNIQAPPQHAMPQYPSPQHATPHYPSPQHATPHYPSPQHATPQYATHPAPHGPAVDVHSRLAQLNDLRVSGALTDAEFSSEKMKLLGHQ